VADIFTHVLAAYVLATLLSIRYRRLAPRYVTVAMMGAMIPDLTKARILVDGARIETTLGIPFSWGALHTLGGSLVAVFVGVVLAGADQRKRVFLALVLGMLSHHALDHLIVHPSGHAYDVFWPVARYRIPYSGFYHSSDRWPALVATLAAAGAHLLRRRTLGDGK
jgi:hypothetical protein